jgi:hypothetical protein
MGRDPECEVQIESGLVSRRHLEVTCENDQWWIEDLDSTNGTYVGDKKIQRMELNESLELQLGQQGPVVRLQKASGEAPVRRRTTVEESPREAHSPSRSSSLTGYIQHYFDEADSEAPAGTHTVMIRRAYEAVRQNQQRKYYWVLGVVIGLLLITLAYSVFQYVHNRRLETMAEELIYQLKEVDMAIAQQRQIIEQMEGERLSEQLSRLRQQRERLAVRYEGYVQELGIRRRLSEDERLIHKVARIFNESEFEVPAGFIREVREEIRDYWLDEGRDRFITAIRRAEENGHTGHIVRTMQRHNLAPEFFYLALQESDLRIESVGVRTRWGIAKGMWQFIPSTARAYGLKVGPREHDRAVDRQDDRYDFHKSTVAAARYLSDLYGSLAQASGLLAIAAYNWGETRIVGKLDPMLDDIPESPRARSYWNFYREYEALMPQETKDYVLRVFAAAVIGQNPRFFGLDMDNPLQPYLEMPEPEGL